MRCSEPLRLTCLLLPKEPAAQQSRRPSAVAELRGVRPRSRVVMIPTLYKARLPRDLSFPIGAEALSEHLAEAPHISEFQICFSDVVSAWKSKFQKILAEGADYQIVRLQFWSPFEIYVYPVQRVLKHLAHEALISQGLPQLRDWMVRQGARTTMMVGSCSIVFSPPTQSVHLQEHYHVA